MEIVWYNYLSKFYALPVLFRFLLVVITLLLIFAPFIYVVLSNDSGNGIICILLSIAAIISIIYLAYLGYNDSVYIESCIVKIADEKVLLNDVMLDWEFESRQGDYYLIKPKEGKKKEAVDFYER